MGTAVGTVLSCALAAGGLFYQPEIDLCGAPISGLTEYFPGLEERPRNALMVNPLALLFGEVDVTYEYAASGGRSLGAMISLVSLESGSQTVSAIMVLPQLKGYPGGKAPQGGFYGLGLGFMALSYEDSASPSDNVDLTTLSYLVYGGYKWVSEGFAFELGGGLMSVAGLGVVVASPYLHLALGVAF